MAVAKDTSGDDSAEYWFTYEPLDLSRDSIRLIKVLPELSNEGRIQCQLWHSTTTSDSNYQCLSYQWKPAGVTEVQQIMLLNGALFTVLPNLFSFLKSFQANLPATAYSRALWVDAICIDQASTKERNHQVGQMQDIYSRAGEVIIWLGEGDRHQQRALSKLQRAWENTSDSSDCGRLVLKDNTYEQHFLHALVALSRNEYWQRVWIVQEVTLAKRKTIMVSRVRVDWRCWCDFHDSVVWAHTGKNLSPARRPQQEPSMLSLIRAILNKGLSHDMIRPSPQVQFQHTSLREILYRFGHFNCSDNRDRVFAVCGLSFEGSQVKIDYDITPDQLFWVVRPLIAGGLLESIAYDRLLAVILEVPVSRLQSRQEVFTFDLSVRPAYLCETLNWRDPLAQVECEHCGILVGYFERDTRYHHDEWLRGKSDNYSRLRILCLKEIGTRDHLLFEPEQTFRSWDDDVPLVARFAGLAVPERREAALGAVTELQTWLSGVTLSKIHPKPLEEHWLLKMDTKAYLCLLDTTLWSLR